MSLRKASAYSKKKARPYTRKSKSKGKAYIKTVPYSKVVKFSEGSQKDYREGKHPFVVRLIALGRVQIRDNALESTRMWLTKILEEKAPGQFHIALKLYPHHFLRENKLSAGAGADRTSTGMSHSYGIVVGRAAIVKPGQEIYLVSCTNEKAARLARDCLIALKSKIPGACQVLFEIKKDSQKKQ